MSGAIKTSTGIKTIEITDTELADFYENGENRWGCLNNTYIVFNTQYKQLVGPYLFKDNVFTEVAHRTFSSSMFGDIKPKDNDPYQIAYMDSIVRNQLTFATGKAGSGKSLLALAFAFQLLEKGKIDRLVIFANPWIARGASKMGFLPGTKTEKMLETSVGGILLSKLGSRVFIEELIAGEKLILMSIGECRGYETPPNSFVYFSEAQNTDRYLMQLFLQRQNDESKVIVEGDIDGQVDDGAFSNGYNGLARAIEVFIGEEYAAHTELKTIYRSRIAKKADEM